MKGENDLIIGEKERIQRIDFDPSGENLTNVDDVLKTQNDFWENLQVFCLSGCCGLGAFRFYPADIRNAADGLDTALLKENLSKLKDDLLKSEKKAVASLSFNFSMAKTVFVTLLDHIIDHI
ncbi:MAG: hypothetical protein EOP56_17385 [Sphingobacteriales bacterium]|nr:MAG: hypothetical protein EOP56_17385 [Sphingobacteriales bacterium]